MAVASYNGVAAALRHHSHSMRQYTNQFDPSSSTGITRNNSFYLTCASRYKRSWFSRIMVA